MPKTAKEATKKEAPTQEKTNPQANGEAPVEVDAKVETPVEETPAVPEAETPATEVEEAKSTPEAPAEEKPKTLAELIAEAEATLAELKEKQEAELTPAERRKATGGRIKQMRNFESKRTCFGCQKSAGIPYIRGPWGITLCLDCGMGWMSDVADAADEMEAKYLRDVAELVPFEGVNTHGE